MNATDQSRLQKAGSKFTEKIGQFVETNDRFAFFRVFDN